MVPQLRRALFLGALAFSSSWAATAAAQDAPTSQRISSGALREQIRRRPQGVTVPVEITKQGDKVVLQTADGAVQVANPNVIAQQVRQMPVQAVVSDAASGAPGDAAGGAAGSAPDGAVQVQDVQLQASKKWNDRTSTWRAKYRRLDAAQQRLDTVAERALAPDATDADLRQLKQATDAAQQQVVAAYKTLPEGDRAEQRVLVEQHAELRRLEKSLYGRDDRYPPQAYERIYANSRGAFALRAKREEKPRCSAVLIGEKLALTNNHCILEEAADEFEAVFDYEDDLAGNRMPKKTFPVADIRLTDEDARGKLDFVLLELGANTDGALPGAAYPVQCLSQAPVRRDEPLYVVGYPLGEPRTVHDNTFVYFPFRLSEDEYVELKLLVSAEFDSLQAEDALVPRGQAQGIHRQLPPARGRRRAVLRVHQRALRRATDDRRRQRHLPRQLRLAGVSPPLACGGRSAVRRPGGPVAAMGAGLALARGGAADRRDRRAPGRGGTRMAQRSARVRAAGGVRIRGLWFVARVSGAHPGNRAKSRLRSAYPGYVGRGHHEFS